MKKKTYKVVYDKFGLAHTNKNEQESANSRYDLKRAEALFKKTRREEKVRYSAAA